MITSTFVHRTPDGPVFLHDFQLDPEQVVMFDIYNEEMRYKNGNSRKFRKFRKRYRVELAEGNDPMVIFAVNGPDVFTKLQSALKGRYTATKGTSSIYVNHKEHKAVNWMFCIDKFWKQENMS